MRTPGFTGADLTNLLNEGALLRGHNRKKIEMRSSRSHREIGSRPCEEGQVMSVKEESGGLPRQAMRFLVIFFQMLIQWSRCLSSVAAELAATL